MNREHDAGREYAEIWGKTVEANRKLRTLAMILGGACLALAVLLLRVATVEPSRPIVVRVDEVGRAEAVAYEAATAQADPLDPTTKYFLNRFIADFYSRRRATVEEHWTRSLRLPIDRAGERCVHARRRRGRRHGGRHRRHRAPGRAGRAPHPPRTGGAARRDGRLRSGPPQAGAGDPERERWSLTLRFMFLTVIPSELVVYNPMGILHHLPPGRPGPGHGSPAMIAHLAGRERRRSSRSGGRYARPSGSLSHVSTAACSSGPSGLRLSYGCASLNRLRRVRPRPDRSEGWRRTEETVPGIRGIGRVCRIFGLGRSTGRSAPRTSAIAGPLPRPCSCAACSRSITCSSITGLPWLPTELREGRRIRGARHRASDPALAALPRSRREHPALFPAEVAGRARGRARPLRLRRARTRHLDGATLVGRGTSRPLGSAAGARPIRRGRGGRPHREGAAAGPEQAQRPKQLPAQRELFDYISKCSMPFDARPN